MKLWFEFYSHKLLTEEQLRRDYEETWLPNVAEENGLAYLVEESDSCSFETYVSEWLCGYDPCMCEVENADDFIEKSGNPVRFYFNTETQEIVTRDYLVAKEYHDWLEDMEAENGLAYMVANAKDFTVEAYEKLCSTSEGGVLTYIENYTDFARKGVNYETVHG